MKRVTYLLKDEYGTVRARMTMPEDAPVSLEPWMVHNVHLRGWRLEGWGRDDSGVQVHGWANWEGVADNLATVVRVLLDFDNLDDDEAVERLLEEAQAALDDYHVAQMEVSVARPDLPEEASDGE